jgi:hypothetical protein
MTLRQTRSGCLYRCHVCGCSHAAHPDGSPCGVPGNDATRAARRLAHAAFDPIWQSAPDYYKGPLGRTPQQIRRMARRRAYRWLAFRMGSDGPVHIGAMSDADALQVAAICLQATYGDVRAWFKAQQVAA